MANTPINAMTATFGIGDQTAIKMNVTDSGPSDALSKLIDLQIGGTSKFKVSKEGYVTATNYTGSVSGSVVIKDSTSLTGNTYLLFVDGAGRRVLRTDSTGLIYEPANDVLRVSSDIYSGGSFDTTNLTTQLLPSPSTIFIGSSATTMELGTTSAGSVIKIKSRQITARSFTGSFSGSISGSVNLKNLSSDVGNKYVVLSTGLSGQKVLGADSDIIFNTSTNSLTTGGEIIAGGNVDTTADPVQLFSIPTTVTLLSSATDLTIGDDVVSSFTKFLTKQVRGHFTGSFTGSISGSVAKFKKISGSDATFTNRVIANSFTGSISGALGIFGTLSASYAYIDKRLIAPHITGSISGSVGKFDTLIANNISIEDGVTSNSFTGSISGSWARFLRLTSSNANVKRRFVAGTITSSLSASLATVSKLTGSVGRITQVLVVGGGYNYFNGTSGTSGVGLGRIRTTSLTGSVSSSIIYFSRLTGSNVFVRNKIRARNFTGSVSASLAKLFILTGSKAVFAKNVIANNFTGSISGSIGNFVNISSSRIRNSKNIISTNFTGSISGSNAWFSNNISASKSYIKNNVVANSFTGSIDGNKAVFVNLTSQKITGSLISSSVGIFTKLTASKVNITSVKSNNVTSSFSGSIYVNINSSNNDFYLLGSLTDQGNTSLLTDPDIIYNRSLKYLWVTSNLMTSNVVTDPTTTTSSLFNNSPTLNIGQNSSIVKIGKTSPKIVLGQTNTQVILSGSITGSISRFTRVSGSRGRILRLSGSHSNFQSSSAIKGNFTRLTSSYNLIDTVTGSNASFSKNITASNARINNDILVMDDLILSGSFNFRYPLTGSGPSSHRLFISGAGALQGYMGIMINNTKYKIPLYAW